MANDKLKQNFRDIANSIRAKTGKNGTIKADEMSAEIDSIPVGIEPEGTKEIRNNGDFNIREFENVHVDVPGATTKELFEATENGTYDIAEYANVKVEVPNPSTGTKDIVANGNYDVTSYAEVNVDVPDSSDYLYSYTWYYYLGDKEFRDGPSSYGLYYLDSSGYATEVSESASGSESMQQGYYYCNGYPINAAWSYSSGSDVSIDISCLDYRGEAYEHLLCPIADLQEVGDSKEIQDDYGRVFTVTLTQRY